MAASRDVPVLSSQPQMNLSLLKWPTIHHHCDLCDEHEFVWGMGPQVDYTCTPQCKPGPSICQNFWQYGWYHNNDHDHDDDGDGSGGNNSDNNNNSDYDVDDGVDDHEEENIVDDGDGDPRVNPCYQSVKTWLIW